MNVFPQGYFGPRKVYHTDGTMMFDSLTSYKKKYLVPFLKSLPQNARVLDVGCGKGKTIALIMELRPDIDIFGCDITDVSTFMPPGVSFVQCSADEISSHFNAQSFDAVICQHVIEHLAYSTDMVASFLEILKSGGKFFLETPNWTRLLVPFSPLYFWDDYTHIHPFSSTSIRRLFNEFDFIEELIVSVSTVDVGSRIKKFSSNETESPDGIMKAKAVGQKKPFLRKLFDAVLDLTVHQILRDVIVAVAIKK